MKELIRTNDPVLLMTLKTRLESEGIDSLVFDTHASIIEGSISAIPRRVMVIDDDFEQAFGILQKMENGIEND
ncbi:MAG: DUF2007 domain-containing protein [Rhodospirillales bacterium]|nr:DUF2007 domain-containing protein [Rhodospirillales bacterium]